LLKEENNMNEKTFGNELIDSMKEAVKMQNGRYAAKKTKGTVTRCVFR
jgi:hypothetical protein